MGKLSSIYNYGSYATGRPVFLGSPLSVFGFHHIMIPNSKEKGNWNDFLYLFRANRTRKCSWMVTWPRISQLTWWCHHGVVRLRTSSLLSQLGKCSIRQYQDTWIEWLRVDCGKGNDALLYAYWLKILLHVCKVWVSNKGHQHRQWQRKTKATTVVINSDQLHKFALFKVSHYCIVDYGIIKPTWSNA